MAVKKKKKNKTKRKSRTILDGVERIQEGHLRMYKSKPKMAYRGLC